jgi:hypothetical protein
VRFARIATEEQGQTSHGRLSGVAQAVRWQVDPATYGGNTTFDITVTFDENSAASQPTFWNGPFHPEESGFDDPTGYCNIFDCSCLMPFLNTVLSYTPTFQVPIPSSTGCPSG